MKNYGLYQIFDTLKLEMVIESQILKFCKNVMKKDVIKKIFLFYLTIFYHNLFHHKCFFFNFENFSIANKLASKNIFKTNLTYFFLFFYHTFFQLFFCVTIVNEERQRLPKIDQLSLCLKCCFDLLRLFSLNL